jgi:hypothetical protein
MADSGRPLKPGTGKVKGEPPRLEEKGRPTQGGQELAADYGVSWAIIQSDPGLMAWFNDFAKRYAAAKGKISQQAFTLELQQQPWWKQHSASWIADRQQELEDPVGYQQSLESDIAAVSNVANAMGAQVDSATALEIAKNKRRFGWNDSQLQSALAAHVDVSGGDLTGNAGTAQDELMLWAKKNGLTLTPDLVGKYVQRVAAGELTVDDVKGDIRNTYMAGAYPGWADKISAGFDIAELAAPYQEAAHSLLEDRTIGLDDPLMKKLLQSVGPDGKPSVVPLYEAEKMIRADKRWQTTDNAYNLYANAAQNILRTWGFA